MSILALIRVQWKAGRVVDAMKSLLAGNQRKGGIEEVISLALESVLTGFFFLCLVERLRIAVWGFLTILMGFQQNLWQRSVE